MITLTVTAETASDFEKQVSILRPFLAGHLGSSGPNMNAPGAEPSASEAVRVAENIAPESPQAFAPAEPDEAKPARQRQPRAPRARTTEEILRGEVVEFVAEPAAETGSEPVRVYDIADIRAAINLAGARLEKVGSRVLTERLLDIFGEYPAENGAIPKKVGDIPENKRGELIRRIEALTEADFAVLQKEGGA